MKGFIRLIILSAMIANLTSCSSRPVEDDMELDDAGSSSEVVAADSSGGAEDDFAGFDEAKSEASTEESTSKESSDIALEDEFQDAEGTKEPAKTAQADELSIEDEFAEKTETAKQPEPKVEDELSIEEPAQAPVPDVPVAETPVPQPEQQPPAPEVPTMAVANITDLKFKANDAGGTIIVQADKPITYTTRANPDLKQFIIEVENASLPDRLKRSLNTRDIKGSIGAIDAYQNPGSNTARFVIQLREGVAEPTVQLEGNSLLVVANLAGGESAPGISAEPGVPTPAPAPDMAAGEVSSGAGEETEAVSESKILSSQNLTEFLAGNTKFYGKKISIETSNIDIRDALNLITEESGVNMVIADEVKGPLSLKLRQVPWDQALVVIMKAKKLGYTRQGNVLRIAALQDLRTEEDDANKLAQARKNIEPLKVRMFPVSYAKVDELEKKIKDFLGERGKVVGDVRTNALVVTDIPENLDRVAKLIASLDTQPPQVLIESKIVEASESFTRNIGINWGATGSPVKLGSTSRGPVNMSPTFNMNPSVSSGSAGFNFDISMGTLDVFGTLQAALALSEVEEQVKVISSPRIMTMTNEKADINQTTEVPVRKVTPNATGPAQESFEFKPLTLKLEVTPQVTADGSVIMKVSVNRQFRGGDVSSAGQGAFAVNSREANTRVLVRNGQTAVIGGIYQSDAVDGENGTPWLREIPVISYLFKSKNISKTKSELLVFLTPRIIAPISSDGDASTNPSEVY